MDQIKFSNRILSFLEEKYKSVDTIIKYYDNNSFDYLVRSPSDLFAVYVATYNAEIKIGIEDPTGNTDIHTHISCYEDEDMADALNELSRQLDDIEEEVTVLYRSRNGGYQWTNDLRSLTKTTVENFTIIPWKSN